MNKHVLLYVVNFSSYSLVYRFIYIYIFWFGGILGSASRPEFPVSLSNHVGSTPRLL